MAKISAALILALLITAIAENLLAYSVSANPLPSTKPIYAEVSIQSPENTSSSGNTQSTYGSIVQFSFNIETNRFVESFNNYSDSHCFIYLNSKSVEFKGLQKVGQTTISDDNGYDPYTQQTLHGNTSISNLATGTYTLEVKYGFYYAWPNNSYTVDYIVLSSASVIFSVESNVNPGSEPIISIPNVKADSNNPIVFSGGITIYSPVNTTYHTNYLNLNLTCNCGIGLKIYFSYDIDRKDQGPITLTFNDTSGSGFQIMALGSALVQLPRLLSGPHQLTVFEDAYLYGYLGANPPGAPFKPTAPGSHDYVASWVDTVYFTIDSDDGSSELIPPKDSTPPAITLLSVENKTYETTDLLLNFTVNEESQLSYSLDGLDNVTIAGNCTLTKLSFGSHSLTLYAKDSAGNVGASRTVDFTIEEIRPFPILLVIAIAVLVAAVVAATTLVFLKKRKPPLARSELKPDTV